MSSNGKLPKGWQRKRLNEVADIRFSSVDKNVFDDEVPVRLCNYMEVWKNPYIHKNLNFMEGSATPDEVRRFSLQPGDVLITKDSETKKEIAEPSLVRDQIENLVLGYHLALLRPDESQAHGPFLAAQLRIPEFRAQFVRAASGVTRYGLSLGAVSSAEVWLPSTFVQQQIADILWSAHDAIERTRAVIDQTRKLKSALVHEMFTKGLPGKRTRFHTVRLGDAFVPRKESGDFNLPLVAVTMHNGLVARDNIERRMETNLTHEQHLLVRAGDIAYNMMRMWQGVFGYAHCDCLVSPAYVVVRPTGSIRSDYGAYLFKHPATIHKFHLYSQGLTEDRLRLYYEQFASIRVRVPKSLDDQSTIVSLLSSVDGRIAAALDELAQLSCTKAALSQVLLTGRVRVPKERGE